MASRTPGPGPIVEAAGTVKCPLPYRSGHFYLIYLRGGFPPPGTRETAGQLPFGRDRNRGQNFFENTELFYGL